MVKFRSSAGGVLIAVEHTLEWIIYLFFLIVHNSALMKETK